MIPHFIEGEGPTVLLVHGFALDARMWRPQVAALRATHRVVTVDLPDFGPSPVGVGEQTAAAAVADVARAVGGGPAHVVGLSLGGAVVVDLALTEPRLLRSLTLIDAPLLGRPTGIKSWPIAVAFAKEGKDEAAREAWLADDLLKSACARPELRALLREMGADYSCKHWRGEATTRFAYDDPGPRLSEIAVPTLVLVGEHDLATFHATADEYAATIRGARKETIAGAGHLASLEAPEAVNERLVRFFASA